MRIDGFGGKHASGNEYIMINRLKDDGHKSDIVYYLAMIYMLECVFCLVNKSQRHKKIFVNINQFTRCFL